MSLKTYTHLSNLKTFEERYEYLKLDGSIGLDTFGFDRYINQKFYTSQEWRHLRDQIIIRDNGCDLGLEPFSIPGKILIHHLNPIKVNDIVEQTSILLNPEFLICVSHETHNAIHYGDKSKLPKYTITQRMPNDTCPWKH